MKMNNEIDYVLSNHNTIIKDVSIINNFTIDSNHRMFRTIINSRPERSRQMKKFTYYRSSIEKRKHRKFEGKNYRKSTARSIPCI